MTLFKKYLIILIAILSFNSFGQLTNDFQIITQRNIFDSLRKPYQQKVENVTLPRIESFYLAGISEKVNKGFIVFFNGHGIYKKTYLIGDTVNKFTIKNVDFKQIELMDTNNNKIILKPTDGFIRTNYEEWSPYNHPIIYNKNKY